MIVVDVDIWRGRGGGLLHGVQVVLKGAEVVHGEALEVGSHRTAHRGFCIGLCVLTYLIIGPRRLIVVAL